MSAPGASWRGRRVAIAHDWFPGFLGSERVVDAMVGDVFADADAVDVLTFQAARDELPERLARAIRRDSRLSRLPLIRQREGHPGRWRYLLPLMPRYFRNLPLDGYDLVVASSHACALQVRPPAGVPYVCYSHTPMRYAWLPDTESERVRGLNRLALRAAAGALRRGDLAASRRPDSFVANSSTVRERIQRFYGRDAVVVHPPVDTQDFDPARPKRPGHFLWVHRLVAYKRPELVVEAFRGLPFSLTMVGVGPLEARLRRSLPANVELRGWLPRDELADLYARCSGFVHVGEEDFGISMVEALAAGMPVIALNRGGARDIVRDGVDGVLVDEPAVEALRAAVIEAAAREWSSAALAARAETFSRARFAAAFGRHVAEVAARVRGAAVSR